MNKDINFDSQPGAFLIATVRMVGELAFAQRYVNATVDGQEHAVIHVRLPVCNSFTVILASK